MFSYGLETFITGTLVVISFFTYRQTKFLSDKKVRGAFEGLITSIMALSLLVFLINLGKLIGLF